MANAIVHRSLDINSLIKISMFNDRIEIVSPGGLPRGISKEEYLEGNLLLLRNPIIANVFYRLNIIEMFGTGIARIKTAYAKDVMKPVFSFLENSIKIQLPVLDINPIKFTDAEEKVYSLIKSSISMSRSDLDLATGYDKAKTIRTLNSLLKKKVIEKKEAGPNTVYYLAGMQATND